jgi:hypothetical protein
MKYFIPLIVIFGLIHIRGFSQSDKADLSGWKTIEKKYFTIQYPQNWIVDSTQETGTNLSILLPVAQNDTTGNGFITNLEIIWQDFSGVNMDINKYAGICEDLIKGPFINGKIVESKRQVQNNNELHKIIYSSTENNISLTSEQHIFIKAKIAFRITFTTQEKKYEKEKITGEAILGSFKLK